MIGGEEAHIKEMRWWGSISCAFATSLLLLFSFPPFNVNLLAFIALVPIFAVTFTANTGRTLVFGIASSYLFHCLHLFWTNAYLPVVGVTFVTIVYGGYMTAALLLINFTARAFPGWRAVLTPFLWVAVEYVRRFGFLGVTFGSVGYTQHGFLRFIQIADIGGEPLVSFIIVFFNAGLAHLILKLRESGLPLPLAGLPLTVSVTLIVLSLLYGSERLSESVPDTPGMKIALIQGLSSPRTAWREERWPTLFRLIELSEESHRESPDVDLIVWTETAIRTSLRPNFISETPYHMEIKRLVKRLGTHFIIGSPDNFTRESLGSADAEKLARINPARDDGEIWTNSAYYLNPDGEIIGKYDKIHLTPFGEHFPLGRYLPFLHKILDRFTDSAEFTPGRDYTVFQGSKLDFSVVICWEGMYGHLIRRFVSGGAQFVINISNDMWTGTRAGHLQHFTVTRFRAIENRIWFVRAANDGVTAFVNPLGEVLGELPIGEAGYLTGRIGPRVRGTVYTRYGDVLPKTSLAVLAASFAASLCILIRDGARKRKQRHQGK